MIKQFSAKRGQPKRTNRLFTIALSNGRTTQVYTWCMAQAKKIAAIAHNVPAVGKGKL